MTDIKALKALAEAVRELEDQPEKSYEHEEAKDALWLHMHCHTVLDLIAEIETLGRYLCTCRDCGGEGALHTGRWHSHHHMEPPEPEMEKCGECDGTGLLGEIQDLHQVIAERDQLKAENTDLHATLKAAKGEIERLKGECEALRKDADRLDRLDEECEAYGTDIHEGNRWVVDVPFATVRDAIDAAMSKEAEV